MSRPFPRDEPLMSARRVLLVDDEPRIVAGLQRLLRPHRNEWEAVTATSGQDALRILADLRVDVVVSDMRMPGMDGAKLLAMVREKHPDTMRVVLSGQTDADTALRVVPFAHQFLSKPTPPEVLIDVLRRVVRIQRDVVDPEVRAIIGGVDALPPAPMVMLAVNEVLARDDASLDAVAKVVESDAAIVSKLLQIVNSAFFGARRRIASVPEAIAYLGTEHLKQLVVLVSVAAALPSRSKHYDAQALHEHSYAVARAAAALADGAELRHAAFAAGLLHEVGKLVMASRMPELYDTVCALAHQTGRTFEEAEAEAGSPGHARVGGCLLELWGLPREIVDAVLDQDAAPAPTAESNPTVRDILRAAHASAIEEAALSSLGAA